MDVLLHCLDTTLHCVCDRCAADFDRPFHQSVEAILAEETEEFYHWYEARDAVPRIQSLKCAAGQDVCARLSPAFRRAQLEPEQRERLLLETEGAVERMVNRLLFGLRARLPGNAFSDCMEAMEAIFEEKGE